jgi:hypothetical protein
MPFGLLLTAVRKQFSAAARLSVNLLDDADDADDADEDD